jgi:hypothetical protein
MGKGHVPEIIQHVGFVISVVLTITCIYETNPKENNKVMTI